jgi:hypothetical protein
MWAQLYRSTVAVSAAADVAWTQSAVETHRMAAGTQQMEQLQTMVRRCIALGLVWLVVFVKAIGSVSTFIWGNLGVLLVAVELYALLRDR